MQKNLNAPVLFAGHGSPLNAIGENRARTGWRALEKPRAIAAVSAHWQVTCLSVRTAADNPQINDMYGFPEELYRVRYAPPGDPALAARILELLGPGAREDNRWGLDHGAWTVLSNLFPGADVPVVMVGVPAAASAEVQYEAGRALSALRAEGVMLLASGNVVHNLGRVDWGMTDGYDWARDFDGRVREEILAGRIGTLLRWSALPSARLAVPTPEHFTPLLTALGAATPEDSVAVFNDFCELGSMSMTSYLFRAPQA